MLMQSVDTTLQTLDQLKEMGVRLAIDDFGTGYSSLSYLKRFPLDTLKIDRSFVKDLPRDAEDAAITKAIIAMAHSLRLAVVAEGVETTEQLAFLQQHGCDVVQGYLFSRPVSADDFGALLAAQDQRAAAAG
jgi:EAL domain-containing protein (putative c-di-GMP-specific phosphodiesterase class I)